MGDFSGIQKFKLYNLHKSIGITISRADDPEVVLALRPHRSRFAGFRDKAGTRRGAFLAFRPLRSIVSDAALRVGHDISVGQAVCPFRIHRLAG